MSPGEMLIAFLIGLAVNECCPVSDWAARRLIGWAARLSYGDTSRGQIRLAEQTGDLDRCLGQLGKLCYALGYAVKGILTWMRRVAERSAAPDGERPGTVCRRGAAAEAVCLALRGFDDIRALPRGRRKEFGALTTRLRALLRHPAETFVQDSAARILTATASACEAYIDDRDERTAESLAEAAGPLAEQLGRCHPAVLSVRRAHAHALLQLGRHERAELLLRELSSHETGIFGRGDPRTFQTRRLLNWALLNAERFQEAEAGFRAIDADMAQLSGADVPLRLHVWCMLSWTISRQGRLRQATDSYDTVIAGRSRELGPDHPDTLDARHSKGKMFVLSGDGSRARAVLRPLLADRRRVQRARHLDTLETRKYLAVACSLARPHSSARAQRKTLRELRHVLRRQTKKLGPDHPNAHDTQQWLATLARPAERR